VYIFRVTLVDPRMISSALSVSNALRLICLWSKEFYNSCRATAWTQTKVFRTFLILPLLFAIGCRSHRLNLDPSLEFTRIRIVRLGTIVLIAALLYRRRMTHLKSQLNVRFQERLAERTRIAQELHDTLLQSFQGLILRFQAATEIVLSDPQDAKDTLERALDRADQALAEGRKAIQGMRTVPATRGDLADALNSLMSELLEEFSFAKQAVPITSVLAEGQPRIVNPWIADEVCKIAKEALWNAFSHARAQRIESEVAYSEQFLRLRFRDDGIGIDRAILEDGGRTGHWGLSGMNERAGNVHGRLSIWSKPGSGTEVELTIPAHAAFQANASRGWFQRFHRKVNIQ
jgi:signal transduction histidine kinase